MKQLHLTENFINKSADELISKLRQQHAADEEYIHELEEGLNPKYELIISEMKDKINKYDSLKKEYTNLNSKYIQLLNSPELKINEYKQTIQDLENKLKEANLLRDHLLFQLYGQSK